MGHHEVCPQCSGKSLYFVSNVPYAPSEQKEYERFAALCAQQGMSRFRGSVLPEGLNPNADLNKPGHSDLPGKFSGPTRVECRFYFGIPKSREKKLKEGDWHTQRPDTDNCVKSVWDAMNKICFADDCMVVQMVAEKRWTTGVPRTEVSISSLAEGGPKARTEAEQEASV